MELGLIILIAIVAVPMVLATTVIGIPIAMQFANGVSSRMSVNAANALDETAASGKQASHK